jgi:PAS domain S-box-containing protein
MPIEFQEDKGEIRVADYETDQLISESLYRTVFETTGTATIIIEEDTTISHVNKKFESLSGYLKEEIEGKKSWKDVIEKSCLEKMIMYHRVRRINPDGAPGSYECRFIDRNDDVKDVYVTVAMIPGTKKSVASLLDITESIKAQQALQESEERYKTAIENSNDGVLIVKDGKCISVNRKLVEMLGYDTAEEIEGKHIAAIVHPDFVNQVIGIRTGRQDEEYAPSTYEIRHVRKNGTFLDAEASATKTVLKGEMVSLVYLRDITNRKLAEEALRKREKELEIKSINLEEANTALKVLLRNREEDKKALKDTILGNVRELVFPYIEKLKNGHLNDNQTAYIGILETNLSDIISPFLQKMTSRYSLFTPTEIQVANLIKSGKTSKEIAELMNVSTGTIDTHRNSIRSKLDLNKKKINLRTFLLSL